MPLYFSFHSNNIKYLQSVATTNNTSVIIITNSTTANLTLGNPQIVYTEYGKTTNMIPFVVNGTHGFRLSFAGSGTVQNINVTDDGKAISIPRADGSIFSRGVGVLTANSSSITANGSSSKAIAAFGFLGTGHYGSDGKLRDFGLVYFLNANGNLGFLKGIAGVYKDQIDKIGNAVTRLWLWKQ